MVGFLVALPLIPEAPMLGPSFPLRQVSDEVLQELHPDRMDRPFEWRRDFHIINFVISNPQVRVSYQLHDLAFSFGNRDPATFGPLVKAGSGVRLSIHGSVKRLERGDNFVHTKPSSSGDETLFDTFPAQGSLQIEISSCDPYEGNEIFGPATYPGVLYSWDPDLERDSLTLSLYLPSTALREIADAIRAGKADALSLQVGVRVFTYEVDDALREPYHQQTFVFHGHTEPAAILRIETLETAPSTDRDYDALTEPSTESDLPAAPSTPLPTPTLTSVANPLWVIAGLLLLLVLLR